MIYSSGFCTELNTHPFGHGEYAFMHNGEIAQFRHLRRALMERLDEAFYELIDGTTDSECLFAHILQSLAGNETVTALTMSAAMENVIADIVGFSQDRNISEPSYVNIALSNGLEAVACRYTNHGRLRARNFLESC